MTQTTLKPCPFCGREPIYVEKNLYTSIECTWANSHEVRVVECSPKLAKEHWNVRI